MASWVAWGVLAIVAVVLGLVGTFFSVRTLRLFSVITAAVAVIAITRYGYGLAHPPSSNLANAFTSGADAVIKDLLHVLWLGQPTPPPGPIGRGVVAALLLLGYRALEAWAMRRQAPQLDISAVGEPADDKDKQPDPLTDELKFRLSAMEIRAPAILPGGSRTNELASIAEATLEDALFESGRPVLMVPKTTAAPLGEIVAIAWNGSTETAVTVALGMPFLKQAREVVVVTVGPQHMPEPGPSGEELARSLEAHGLNVSLRTALGRQKAQGESFLKEATAAGADLLLKGAYTQSRIRQMIFGGGTRHIIMESKMPVLMAR